MAFCAHAQKPFVEGAIAYKVKLEATDNKVYEGVYNFTFKGGRIRKELKLNNGYQDVLVINCTNNSAYSLQTRNGKKFAIQLNMAEIATRQKKFAGYTFNENRNIGKIIAGITVFKGEIVYPDGNRSVVYYTPDWYPDKSITFERFPDVRFMPLSFDYKDENGFIMHMEAEHVSVSPVENSVFNIPDDYRIISHQEYKQLSKGR